MHIWFKWDSFIWTVNAPSKRQRWPNKNSNISHKKSYFSNLSNSLPKHERKLLLFLLPLHRQKVSLYCRRHLELQTKSPEGPEVKLTWKPPQLGLVFMVLKGPCKLPKKDGKQLTVLPSYNVKEPSKRSVWHENHKGAVVVSISWW